MAFEPYIGREFHGIWGDYDVTLHLPERYVVGATGVRFSTNCGHARRQSWPEAPLQGRERH